MRLGKQTKNLNSRQREAGGALFNVLIMIGVGSAMMVGITKSLNLTMKANRQVEVKGTIASARRIIEKSFSCEKSLGAAAGQPVTCGTFPILDASGKSLLNPIGKLASLDIYLNQKCNPGGGISFQYMRAAEKGGKLEELPDPLTGLKKGFTDLFTGKMFCGSNFGATASTLAPSSAPAGTGILPKVTCGPGRIWSGMQNGVPICSSPQESLRGLPKCVAATGAMQITIGGGCANAGGMSVCSEPRTTNIPAMPARCSAGTVATAPKCTMTTDVKDNVTVYVEKCS